VTAISCAAWRPGRNPATTTYADTGLSVGTYSYTVAARDAAGNISPDSTSVSVTLADTTAPTTPAGLTAAAAGSTGVTCPGALSTDNVGVTAISCAAMASSRDPATDEFCRQRACLPQRPTATPWRLATQPATSHLIRRAWSVTLADTTAPTTPAGLTAAAPVRPESTCPGALQPTTWVTGYIVAAMASSRDPRHDKLTRIRFVRWNLQL